MWIWFLGIFIHTCGAADDDGRLNQVIDSSLQLNAGKVYPYEQTLPQNDAELLKPVEQGNPNPLESISLLKTRHAIEIEELRKRQELRNEKFRSQQKAQQEEFKKRRKTLDREPKRRPDKKAKKLLELRIKRAEFRSEQRPAFCELQKLWALEDEQCQKLEERYIPSPIPIVAQGHEAIYERFIRGGLIFSSTRNDEGNIVVKLPIRKLDNPLEGPFNLARCGTRGEYLRISTGYRKQRNLKNEKKVEIWIALRFLIEKELNDTAAYLKPIMAEWKEENPVGIFWNWGENSIEVYSYVTLSMERLFQSSLYEHYAHHKRSPHVYIFEPDRYRNIGNCLGIGRLCGSEFLCADEVE